MFDSYINELKKTTTIIFGFILFDIQIWIDFYELTRQKKMTLKLGSSLVSNERRIKTIDSDQFINSFLIFGFFRYLSLD